MCMRRLAFAIPFAVMLSFLEHASAAPVLIVSGGELMGATGVDVGGTLYDVSFVEGSCVTLFDACDAPADFTFTTQAAATVAANALLAQVFVNSPAGQFDAITQLTYGCESVTDCLAIIPYEVSTTIYSFVAARNESSGNSDNPSFQSFFAAGLDPARNYDTSSGMNNNAYVYAQFELSTDPAAVPEPTSLLLFGSGIVAIAAKARRRRNQ